jgi:hypothetical protein
MSAPQQPPAPSQDLSLTKLTIEVSMRPDGQRVLSVTPSADATLDELLVMLRRAEHQLILKGRGCCCAHDRT